MAQPAHNTTVHQHDLPEEDISIVLQRDEDRHPQDEPGLESPTDDDVHDIDVDRVAFRRYPQIPGVNQLLQDPHYNPGQPMIAPHILTALDELVRETNDRGNALESQKIAIAERWALTRIDRGDYQPVIHGYIARPHVGTIAVVVSESESTHSRLVIIEPGENAELDVIAAEIELIMKKAHAQISELISGKKK